MKIVILGSDSQIGKLFKNNSEKYKFYLLDKTKLNLLNIDSAFKILKKIQPQIIINTAAFTDVDLAEIKKKEAFDVNAMGAMNIAKIASDIKAYLIHFSTDYVFDGTQNKQYSEKDNTNPISIYGKSKLEGEKQIISYNENYLILRISWLYGLYKRNFVTEIINFLKQRKKLRVIDDQFSKPTNSFDTYNALLKIIKYVGEGYNESKIFNYSGDGKATSRYEFANKIANYYCKLNNIKFNISPISSKLYYKRQIRPKFSALNCNKIYKELKIDPIDWKYALENTINEINKR